MKDTELYTALLGVTYPWKVVDVRLDEVQKRIDVFVEDVSLAKHPCPECGLEQAVYDHASVRVWRHLDTCQYETYVHAKMPRVDCEEHGVRKVKAPWASPRSRLTLLYEGKLIDTMKECDITGASRLSGQSWDVLMRVMQKAVERGLARKQRGVPEYIGVDEKSFAKRHRYETIVCDLVERTVEYVTHNRRQESLEEYYQQFTGEELSAISAIAMDMWEPYIAATEEYVLDADKKIVFDRYHVTRYITEAVDKVRRAEHKKISKQGDERLKGTKHLWLFNEENVPEWRWPEFTELKGANLKTARAWAIKESLRHFWDYAYAKNAAKHFKKWYFWATHSRLKPIIDASKTLKRHLPNILTFFKHRITNALSEALNNKIQTIKQMACGYRNREHYKLAIYFHCGGLDLYPRHE
jgi:transposase